MQQLTVQDRVDARVGQAQDVADAVDQSVAVAPVTHQGLENVRAEVLKTFSTVFQCMCRQKSKQIWKFSSTRRRRSCCCCT